MTASLYREIDALGGVGNGDYHQGFSDALTQVLAILERRGFSEAADAPSLKLIADIAYELVMQPGGLRNNGYGLTVVEKADKSDPHYRLCAALQGYMPTIAPRLAEMVLL